MIERADVVIVGGAAVGSATAVFLRREGFSGRIIVVEKDPSYQWCATGRSVASIRRQFSTRENIELSTFGWQYFSSIKETYGPEADVGLVERGYAIMASAEGERVLRANTALQQSLGADVELLGRDALKARFPWLAVDDLAGAGWGRSGEGWLDPHAHLALMRKRAIAEGVSYRADEVVGIDVERGAVAGVRLSSGERLATPMIVCAAGWHSRKVAAMAGIDLPVRPRKRYVFVIDCPTPLPGAGLMIDPSGVYFRPEGRYYIAGVAPPEDEDPDAEDFDIEDGFFERLIWPTLAHRVPAFETLKVVNAWCCHYDLSTLDHNAILGTHPDVGGFLLACGFSGHGLQHSPGIGRAMAELITHGAYRTIDLSRFGWARVAARAPLAEANVF
ncbi:MAG TPA: FAD-dependent oxidoreductase [Hyphomicrobiaceae bacterium]|nr:FAD-dependent oxidoreductase [Hyphomicrobiaceae bacterium]